MNWTNLALLNAGLAVGMGLGLAIGRSHRSRPLQSNLTTPSPSASATPEVPSSELSSPEVQTLTQQLQRTQLAYEMAREMAQFKAGFLGRTSHELRSPINTVISLHQLILADLAEDPAEEREFVNQANHAAKKMLAVLDQLIKISKTMHGTETLNLRSLDWQDVLMELEQFVQLQARNRNIRLQIEYPDSEIFVWADADWLRQSLLNLVDLPIALMPEGTIRLTSAVNQETQQLHLYIEDQRPASFWHEPVDLLSQLQQQSTLLDSSLDSSSKTALLDNVPPDLPTPGLLLLTTQMLLEFMGGRLEVLSVPSSPTSDQPNALRLTRIRCTLLLAA
ncbi:sensor histidine kinase [Thermocoleostomius sinensis]|uniref:histidine kinase n=1 Tax=Thermocoleostomius sinensis A174 TaxID=2016057 RepID=A0A9E8ZH41_9CYAN|nr:HAMP domain-containing sensor histidine kinase [Thermocoleostomius sinensis]WAL61662.1 HAMP domain-containing sensor histidine kinase [Thermocoleostomius sinensis A174]